MKVELRFEFDRLEDAHRYIEFIAGAVKRHREIMKSMSDSKAEEFTKQVRADSVWKHRTSPRWFYIGPSSRLDKRPARC